MKVTRIYTGADGHSHFEDIEVEIGKLQTGEGIVFRHAPPGDVQDWHPAPRRQYIINLDAGVDITASDGEKRRIGAGEIVLVEDTWGKGHLSKAVDGKIRNCVFVPIE